MIVIAKKMEEIFTSAFIDKLKSKSSVFLYEHNCIYLSDYIGESILDQTDLHLLHDEIKSSLELKQKFCACYDVIKDMEKMEIPYACIKGPVLSKMIYENELFRRFNDIDILIDDRYIDKVIKILLTNGFQPGKKIVNGKINPFSRKEKIYILCLMHQTEPYFKLLTNNFIKHVELDINTSIYWDPANDITSYCLKHVEHMEVFGYRVCKLRNEEEFIALCLHHYKDMNSPYKLLQQGVRLSQICDIYFYIKKVSLDKNIVLNMCNEFGISNYIYFCVYICSLIFKDQLLEEYIHLLKTKISNNCIGFFGMKTRYKWNSDLVDLFLEKDLSSEIIPLLLPEDMKIVQRLNYLWGRE